MNINRIKHIASKICFHSHRAMVRLRKRDKHIIVYGGALDLFIDNAKHFFILNNETMPEFRHVWLSRNVETISRVKSLGFEAYNTDSEEGITLSRKAGFFVYDNKIQDFSNHLSSEGAVRIELWHGATYCKFIGAMTSDTQPAYKVKSRFREWFIEEHIYGDYCTSPGKLANRIHSAAFKVPLERIIVSDAPRNRFFYMTDTQLDKYISQYDMDLSGIYSELKEDKRIKIMYMPTFRDGNPLYLSEALPELNALNDFCVKNNVLFLLKVHRITPLPSDLHYSNIMVLDNKMDVYPLLPLVDRLVTDYSSIMYDFALMQKPIILYVYDLKDYVNRSRNVLSEYMEMLNDVSVATNYKELLSLMTKGNDDILHFPVERYYDTPGDISNLHKLIRRLS